MTRVATLTSVALLQGCVAFPAPYLSSMEIFIDEERIGFVEIGETSRAEVLNNLRDPSWKNESGSEWVYALRYGYRGGVGGCFIVAEEIGGSGTCSTPGPKRLYALSLTFDDTGVITDKMVGAATESCSENQDCKFEIGDLVFSLDLQREFEQRRRERGMPLPTNTEDCNVFVTDIEMGGGSFGWKLDEQNWQVNVIGTNQYVFRDATYIVLPAKPGRHSLVVSDKNMLHVTDRDSQSIDFFCESGNPVFLKLAGNSLEYADASDAAEQVLFGSPAKLSQRNW